MNHELGFGPSLIAIEQCLSFFLNSWEREEKEMGKITEATGTGTRTVAETVTAKTRCETMMEKAPAMMISIARVNSLEKKLDTIYEDTRAQVTEKIAAHHSRCLSTSFNLVR
ncbi:hypothetical protein NE237_030592 [Protea cynaroides]|uniref:Uncharacterized protein n=1 Tax=Protea cynaroides TaxID=273540 RepID=A0A9Q0GUI6_9MAGN|nr:hypothetical protein NE237_030592 [Protea cynaroides]